MNKRVTNVASIKYYMLHSEIAGLKGNNAFDDFIENHNSTVGYGNVVKVSWNPLFSNHIGYEYTIRLPDGRELFGDGINIQPNPNLVPEKNHNLNFGFDFLFIQKKLKMDINFFHRQTDNAIFLYAADRGFSGYFNLLKTKGIGISSSMQLQLLNNLSFYGNATCQRIILQAPDAFGRTTQRNVGNRIPNIPYLFANFGSRYHLNNLFARDDRLEINYQNNFVNEFYRSWEADGLKDTKAKIPTQFIHHVNIGYVMPEDKYSLFMECQNLGNQKAFDNFSVQKPGRSFYLKLRIYID